MVNTKGEGLKAIVRVNYRLKRVSGRFLSEKMVMGTVGGFVVGQIKVKE